MMRIMTWLFPGGVLLGSAALLAFGYGPEGLEGRLGVGYPGVVLGVVALLATYFHRSRVVLLAVGLALLQTTLFQEGGDRSGALLMGGVLALIAGFLALSQDRGVFSKPGALQLVGFFFAISLGWFVQAVAPTDVASYLGTSLVPEGLTRWSHLPQPIFLAFAFSVPLAFIAALVRDGPVERGIFWSLLLVALALQPHPDPGSAALCLMGAGLALGFSVMETSYAMAYKDDLTGLPARRALLRDLSGLGGIYSAAMVDVDHFKRFNDRYGHDVGDQVLRMVAGRLEKAPGGGKAYRYGGEEFTVLFPGKSLQESLPHLKEVRRSVEEATFLLRSWRRPRKKPVDPGAWRGTGKPQAKRLSVTVSIGVADTSGKDPSPEAVLKKADQALYRAKKAGRNRVAK